MKKQFRMTLLLLVCAISSIVMGCRILDPGPQDQDKDYNHALLIKATEHSYANLFRGVSISESANEVVLDVRMRVDHPAGYSWGPGITLYWDAVNEVHLQYLSNPDSFDFRWHVLESGGWTDAAVVGETAHAGDWYELRIVYTSDEVEFYIKDELDDDWSLAGVSKAVELGSPSNIKGIIIGKGVNEPAVLGGEKRRSSYTQDIGLPADIYVDYVVLTVDGKELLREDFKGSISSLEADGWDLGADGSITNVRTGEDIFSIVKL